MAKAKRSRELKSTGYEVFILLLSLVAVVNMFVGWLDVVFGIASSTADVIAINNAILTAFFLFDFAYRFLTASVKSNYFLRNWGWADLLACVPQLRIFRLFRILRALRLMRSLGAKNMLSEVINNRAGSALYLTLFSIIMIAETVGILILHAEGGNPDANITSAGDAEWWIFVTMTTVGYGDRFPVTGAGRLMAVFVMLSGVALIGVLASYLSSFFLAPAKPPLVEYTPTDPRGKLTELRTLLAQQQAAQAALSAKINELEALL